MTKCTTPVTELSAKGKGQTLFVWVEWTSQMDGKWLCHYTVLVAKSTSPSSERVSSKMYSRCRCLGLFHAVTVGL